MPRAAPFREWAVSCHFFAAIAARRSLRDAFEFRQYFNALIIEQAQNLVVQCRVATRVAVQMIDIDRMGGGVGHGRSVLAWLRRLGQKRTRPSIKAGLIPRILGARIRPPPRRTALYSLLNESGGLRR